MKKAISSVLICILLVANSATVFADDVNPSGFVSDVLQTENVTKIERSDSNSWMDNIVVIDTTVAPYDPFSTTSTSTQTGVGEILGPSDSSIMQEQQQEQEQETPEELSELDRLNIEKEDAEAQIRENEAMISFNKEELSKELLELEQISQEISDKQQKISSLEMEEIELDKYIKSTTKELTAIQEEYNTQDEAVKSRLIAMYKTRNTSYLDLLLQSKSLSQFLSSYYYIEKIAVADDKLLSDVKDKLEKITSLSNFLETTRAKLEENRDLVEKTQIALTNIQTIKNNRVIELNEDDAKLHEEIEEYRNEIRNIELEIKSLALKNVSARYVGGVMAWPVPGYTRITSPFGYRTHPITGVYKLHSGTDIGAPSGSAFVAANDGVVVKAGWNNAYGNMVIVDHGGGIQTLYAHGSSISVDVGQTVSKGEQVLRVGMTGYATGPHAHFEVRINGEPVEPLDYITSYSGDKKTQTIIQD